MDEASLSRQIEPECTKPTDQKMERINLEFFINLEKAGKKSVIDFCIQMGFIASSYECPECMKPMKLKCYKDRGPNGFAWNCKHKVFNHRRSIRSGSWFEESRLSITMMLKLAYLWVKRTPLYWIDDELKVSTNTVSYWMSFFRRVCVNAIQLDAISIGGPNEIVEIDAKSFSVTKRKQGLETWVFGGVERSSKRCFLEIIHTGEEDEILGILQKYVLPGTTIISDNWKGFNCLKSNGFKHQKLGKTTGFKNSVTGLHKNTILNLWSIVKRVLNKRIGNDQFDAHLAEIMWRRSHQEETQVLLRSYFKLLSQTFVPRVRDDSSHVSKKVEMSKKEDSIRNSSYTEYSKKEFILGNSSDTEFSEKEFILETQPEILNTDNFEEDTHPKDVNTDSFEGGLFQLNCEKDEFKNENESQKKRQKTMESSDI